jgi:hypothetical protein
MASERESADAVDLTIKGKEMAQIKPGRRCPRKGNRFRQITNENRLCSFLNGNPRLLEVV